MSDPGGRAIQVFPDAAAVVAEADRIFRRAAAEAIAERGRFAVALSGGRTPNDLYRSLAANVSPTIDWTRVHVFWSDERCVPPTDPQSNYGNAMAALAGAPLEATNVHRIPAETRPPEAGAAAYEQLLREFFALGTADAVPTFDLMLLGLGPDGHTASLFPGTSALAEQRRLVVSTWVEALSTHRVTLTLPVLNASLLTVFLLTGAEKAGIAQRLLGEGDSDLPAARVLPRLSPPRFLLDALAAARL